MMLQDDLPEMLAQAQTRRAACLEKAMSMEQEIMQLRGRALQFEGQMEVLQELIARAARPTPLPPEDEDAPPAD